MCREFTSYHAVVRKYGNYKTFNVNKSAKEQETETESVELNHAQEEGNVLPSLTDRHGHFRVDNIQQLKVHIGYPTVELKQAM